MVAPALSHPASIGTRVSAYVALTKPRIIELLLVTTIPTMVVAEDGMPPFSLMLATMIGGALAAGGANAINMYVDRDIDAVMDRTKERPLVTGLITPRAALTFAIAIEVLAFVWLWVIVNPLSAVLGLSACLFYVFVYTLWLKRTSSQNIVIGGAAGCIPVLIGWSAVTDSISATFSLAPLTLFALMFFWTPPHFLGLSHQVPRGLRPGRSADVARSGNFSSDHDENVGLHRAGVSLLASLWVGGRYGTVVLGVRGGVGGFIYMVFSGCHAHRIPRQGHSTLYLFDHLHHAVVCSDGG